MSLDTSLFSPLSLSSINGDDHSSSAFSHLLSMHSLHLTSSHLLVFVGWILGSLLITLYGGRYSRLFCFSLGALFGSSIIFLFFRFQNALSNLNVLPISPSFVPSTALNASTSLPLMIGLLFSLMVGMACLLLHRFTLIIILTLNIAWIVKVVS
jgi:hypothetical protein